MKVEHELKTNCIEISMIRWVCGVKLNERNKCLRIGTSQFDNQNEMGWTG